MAVGQLVATEAAHQLQEHSKPMSTGGFNRPDGSTCSSIPIKILVYRYLLPLAFPFCIPLVGYSRSAAVLGTRGNFFQASKRKWESGCGASEAVKISHVGGGGCEL